MPNYYFVSTERVIDDIVALTSLSNKIEITFMTDQILVVPKVEYHPNGYYHIQALLVDDGLYKMYIRLECGSIEYMTIMHDKMINSDLNKVKKTAYYLESRGIVNNFEIPIVSNDSFRSNESTENNYCSSTQAFHGRFHIGNSSFNYYDVEQHDGDVDMTFRPYGCKLRDMSNSTELLSLLSNQHIIFLGDSTLEQVYRGILERLYGPNTFNYDNNSVEWKNICSKYIPSERTNVFKRWFDYDRNNVRLSFMFNGGPTIGSDWRGAVSDDFTSSSDWALYRSELRRIIAESIASCRPITLLFNSGLHDIVSSHINDLLKTTIFQTNLKKSILFLKSTIMTLQSKLSSNAICTNSAIESSYFWVNIIPPVGIKICLGCIVRYLNEIATHVVNKHGFRVLDPHAFLTGMTFIL